MNEGLNEHSPIVIIFYCIMPGDDMRKTPENSYDANPHTKALRPRITLTPQQIESVRQARKDGQAPEEIAISTGLPIDEINIALANLRTKVPNPGRKTLNVSREVHDFVMKNRLPGESVKDASDRLFLTKKK